VIRAEDFAATLRSRQVSRVRRVLYEVAGSFRSDGGPLELTLDAHDSFLLQPAPNGEELAIRAGPWTDPFAPPLSPENKEYVSTHGKWTAIDVSAEAPYKKLLGVTAELVHTVVNPAGTTVGIEVIFRSALLRVDVEGDELVVDVIGIDGGPW
jgi:hypothetical protein